MTPRQIQMGLDIFAASMICAVALALAGLTWRLTGYTGEPPVAAKAAGTTNQPADLGGMIALAPFGKAMAATLGANDSTVRLKGILLAVPASTSTALIAGSDGKVASYGIGAAVGGGVIEAIGADQVMLRMPTGLQSLGFIKSAGGVSSAAITAATGTRPSPATGKPAATGADAIRALIPQSVQGLKAAPSATPAAGPASGGFRIGASAPPALLAAGLRPGDIVEQVNGNAVTAGLNERDLIARVVQAGSAELIVMRNGQRMALSMAMH